MEIIRAERMLLRCHKKSKTQVTKNQAILDASRLLNNGKIDINGFMNKAVYWTATSKTKKLILGKDNGVPQFQDYDVEVENFENLQIEIE